mgnify:CR=1 FL=1
MGNQEGGVVSNKKHFKSYTEEELREDKILKAFSMIEKWRNSGKYCCISIKSDFNYCWRIEIFEYLAERHEPVYIVDGVEDLYMVVLEMDKILPK